MTDKTKNSKRGKKSFIDFVANECMISNGGLVLQLLDGLIDLAQPEHLEWVQHLNDFPIRHINKDEAFSLGFEELSEWSHNDDELVYSEMGVLFNLGNSRHGSFIF